MVKENENVDRPMYNVPVEKTWVLDDPSPDSLGILLVLLEGGEVRWFKFKHKEEEEEAVPLPPPVPQ